MVRIHEAPLAVGAFGRQNLSLDQQPKRSVLIEDQQVPTSGSAVEALLFTSPLLYCHLATSLTEKRKTTDQDVTESL